VAEKKVQVQTINRHRSGGNIQAHILKYLYVYKSKEYDLKILNKFGTKGRYSIESLRIQIYYS
jgi:hypothetical protein